MKMTAKEAALAAGGKIVQGEPGRVGHGISTDSRKHKRREAFVALKGPNFDGHDFIAKAAKDSAPWVMAEKGRVKIKLPDYVALIEVEDTLAGLGAVARAYRRRFKVKIAAVTGSLGKSTTKEMAAALLSCKGQALKNQGNLNNRIGLPQTLFHLNRGYDFAVLEMGCNMPGEIKSLMEIAEPQAGLITRVAPVHLEGLGSIEGVARAKAEMIAGLSPSGTFILNLDDPLIVSKARGFKGRVIAFSARPDAQFPGESLHLGDLEKDAFWGQPRILFTIQRKVAGKKAGSPVKFILKTLFRHDAVNALAACALARAFAVSLPEAAEKLREYRGLSGRGEVVRARNGAFIMNDTYNASPVAVADSLETLAWWKGPMRGVAALGEMRELGPYAEKYHAEVGERAAALGLAALVALGPHARVMAEAAVKAGLPRDAVIVARDNGEAERLLRKLVQRGDWVLVKGSRALGMEALARALAR